MQATADIPLRPLLLCAALGLSVAGCASVDSGQRFAGVRDAVGQRLSQNVTWTRDEDTARAAHDAVKRILAEELTADEAVQVALLNNRRLQTRFESLGIAQADLVEAGLLENPVFSLTVY